jgi:serine/threonine protein kinase
VQSPVDLSTGICAYDNFDLHTLALGRTSVKLTDLGSSVTELPTDTTPFSREHDVLVGAKAGRFVLEERIGAGGMGVVYRAAHEDLGHYAAVKLLHNTSDDRVQRFASEGRTLARLKHPSLIKIFDVGTSPELGNFIVMELLSGVSLEEEIRGGPLPPERAIGVMLQAASALAAAHALDIVHRDIKPANIFLEPHAEGVHVKVLDFGIAKSQSLGSMQTSAVIGTPRYMSPEQWISAPADARADIYSLGLVFYEMLTGLPPYPEAATIPALAAAVMTPLRPLRSECVPDLDPSLEEIVVRMTQIDANERFGSMDQVVLALQQVRAENVQPHRRIHIGKRWFFGSAIAAALGTYVAMALAHTTPAAPPASVGKAETLGLAASAETSVPGRPHEREQTVDPLTLPVANAVASAVASARAPVLPKKLVTPSARKAEADGEVEVPLLK